MEVLLIVNTRCLLPLQRLTTMMMDDVVGLIEFFIIDGGVPSMDKLMHKKIPAAAIYRHFKRILVTYLYVATILHCVC